MISIVKNINTKYIIIAIFIIALMIPVSFIAYSASSSKPIVESSLESAPIAPIVLTPDKPIVLAQNTVKKPVVKKAVAKKKVVKKKAKKKEKLFLVPAILTPATAPHTPR